LNVEGYHCIGCHPGRSDGLLLDPQFDPESRESFDDLTFSRRFEGMNHLVHGGFTSMALDEVMGYAINHQYNRLAVTTRLTVKFLKPLKIDQPYRVSAKVETLDDSRALVRGTIVDPSSGSVLAEAEADFYLLSEAAASKLLPGALAHPATRAMLHPSPNPP
jgi:acyl-coenzyme A thioesterase PaaI-like protein